MGSEKQNSGVTDHAIERLQERNIPAALVQEVIERGAKVYTARGTIEHRLRNILGLRGITLVVVTGREGVVITGFVERQKGK